MIKLNVGDILELGDIKKPIRIESFSIDGARCIITDFETPCEYDVYVAALHSLIDDGNAIVRRPGNIQINNLNEINSKSKVCTNHSYKLYIGLTTSFEYCIICDHKRY